MLARRPVHHGTLATSAECPASCWDSPAEGAGAASIMKELGLSNLAFLIWLVRLTSVVKQPGLVNSLASLWLVGWAIANTLGGIRLSWRHMEQGHLRFAYQAFCSSRHKNSYEGDLATLATAS